MAEITQAARDYLTAVAKKKEAAMARGGQAAADAFVKTQTDKAKYLSGDDNKMQAVAQNRLRAGATATRRAAFEETQRNKPVVKKIPGNVNRNDDPKVKPKKKPDNLGTFISGTFNGQGPFKPVPEDKKQAFYDKAKANLDKRNSGKRP